jgi:hypothetical protein
MLPSTQNVYAPPIENHCTQSKCKVILPDGYEWRVCEKHWNTARLGMQKKQMRERAAKEGQEHSPPIALTPRDNNIGEESDAELKHKVSRITSSF